MKRILFSIVLLITNVIFSQEDKNTSSFTIIDDIKILDEPLFYRNYFSEFQLNKNLFFRTGMEERSTNDLINSYTLIEYPLLSKYLINNRLSVLFGPKIDVLKVDGTIEDLSLFSTFGFQYNFTEDFSVEGKVNYKLTKERLSSTHKCNTLCF